MGKVEQAIILAAGEGQRLRPLTVHRPKVMLSVANKPVLEYVIEALAKNGVRRLVLVVGHRKEQVMNFFGNGEQLGVEISYVVQRQQLGTAHALKQAREMADQEFLVLSGDNIIEPETIVDCLESEPGTILAKEQENISKYGVLVVENDRVRRVEEKPEKVESNLVNTGIYIFDRRVFEGIGEELDLTAALNNMLQNGYSLRVCKTQGTWLDIVYPWDILRLNDGALKKISPSFGGTKESGVSVRGLVSVGKGTVLRSGSYIVGPVIIGDGCEVGPGTCILPSTSIGDNVVLSPFSLVENSVISGNVVVGPHSTLQDSLIDRGSVLGAHFIACRGKAEFWVEGEQHQVEMGTIVGEGCRLDNNVLIQPGVMVGNHSTIQAMKSLYRNIPDGATVV